MNIKSPTNSLEYPGWMQRFRPTDLKWLNAEKTAALCVISESRYRLSIVWTKDGTAKGTRCAEVASTQQTDMKTLEKLFNGFEVCEKTWQTPPDEIAGQIREQLAV